MSKELYQYARRINENIQTSTKKNATQENMEKLAFYDALTGLKNRCCFERDVGGFLPQNLTIIFIDANELKATNDTYGHQTGDELLKSIAASICKVWPEECAYRVGGDEFWVMLQDVDTKAVEEQVARLKQVVSECRVRGKQVSVAIGIARGTPEKTVEQLITEADQEMYKDKRQYKAMRETEIVPTVGTKDIHRMRIKERKDAISLVNDVILCGMEFFALAAIYKFLN